MQFSTFPLFLAVHFKYLSILTFSRAYHLPSFCCCAYDDVSTTNNLLTSVTSFVYENKLISFQVLNRRGVLSCAAEHRRGRKYIRADFPEEKKNFSEFVAIHRIMISSCSLIYQTYEILLCIQYFETVEKETIKARSDKFIL